VITFKEATPVSYYEITWNTPSDGGKEITGYQLQTWRNKDERFTA